MNIFRQHYLYLKNEAALLLKRAVRLGGEQEQALHRFQRLSTLRDISSSDEQALNTIQLKHALAVIALENGYEAWIELKAALEQAAISSLVAEIKDQFYPAGMNVFWNNWFARYNDAKKVLAQGGGYLLPFRRQYFICEAGFIAQLGLSPSLPQWSEIGYDWVHPAHVKSWLQLNALYEPIVRERKLPQE